MLTYEKVFEIFCEYLAVDEEVEVIKTSRGYVRIEWASTAPNCEDGRLCRTPEELFDQLLSDYQSYQEILLTKGRRDLTDEDRRKLQMLCEPYLKKRKEEELE